MKLCLCQIDAKELEKERRIEEALKRIEQLNVSRSESPEVCRMLLLVVRKVTVRSRFYRDSPEF